MLHDLKRPGSGLFSRMLALSLLALLFDGVFASRLPSTKSIIAKRKGYAAEDILRETLSTRYSSGLASGHAELADSFSTANAAQAAYNKASQQSSINTPVTGSLLDPGIATVFSSTAPRILPRLATGPSLSLDQPLDLQQHQQHPHPQPDRWGAIDPPPPQLDIDEATLAGQLASIAYCSHPDLLAAWNCTRCANVTGGFAMHRVVYDSVWDLAAYAGFYPPWNAVVLAFRGTDSSNWGQWAENMRAWRTDHMYPVPDFPHALIHAGFYTLWANSMLQATFKDAVSELLEAHPGARLVTAGHSMGGALAQLAALEAKLSYNKTHVTVYTYGAPRVGNLAYQQLFNTFIDVSWRFTHNRDIVPSVPLQLMGFQHVAREVWEVDVEDPSGGGGGGPVGRKLLMCDGSGEDPSCHNSACYLGLCTSIADHLLYLGLHMYQDSDEC
ncbi:hypothetical protein Agub_g3626 [Astrephomene gubernaculifera]|uniref:Fungal lipase-type domain-containing protein n=1 Tax=Astrephomene gubernaculifera TaxID=47775 RepID=A0AAD3DJJ3_9CHLO|nr:hypothetical protein Agub_g3626 [Astrephomene gubernaculifera]